MGLSPEAIRGSRNGARAARSTTASSAVTPSTSSTEAASAGAALCDAHPELLRAARNVGLVSEVECPICDAPGLKLVSFAFGPGLPPSGRCVVTAKETTSLARRAEPSTCYMVEVCTECAWNHLLRTFSLGRSAPHS